MKTHRHLPGVFGVVALSRCYCPARVGSCRRRRHRKKFELHVFAVDEHERRLRAAARALARGGGEMRARSAALGGTCRDVGLSPSAALRE
jgi:hypothetical protein